MDNKLNKLADTIVDYSIKVKENDKVLITSYIEALPLIKLLVSKIIKRGAIPSVKIKNSELDAIIMRESNLNRVDFVKHLNYEEATFYDAFISIRYTTNDYDSAKTNQDLIKNISEATKESDDIRINEKRWVLLNYPSNVDAYKARMNTQEYITYALDTMIFNYSSMEEQIKPLKELMEKTDKVRIVSPNTDLTFSIKNIPVIPCCGESNIPDGEIYTAPIKDSVNGVITYNTPCPYQGNIYTNVRLEFLDGKIVNATSDRDIDKLNQIFDTDEGARYIGEFSLGLNPLITKPMGDILYDEKIIGSIHFTPGRAYKDAFNGNISGIHWDMVLIQTSEYGGGEIYFDNVLIRKDGKFVLEQLQHLNYNLE